MAAILANDNFKWIFLMKMIEFRLVFHCNFSPGVQMTISQHWFTWCLGTEPATIHYLNQCWQCWRIYAVLGGDESNNTNIYIMTFTVQGHCGVILPLYHWNDSVVSVRLTDNWFVNWHGQQFMGYIHGVFSRCPCIINTWPVCCQCRKGMV